MPRSPNDFSPAGALVGPDLGAADGLGRSLMSTWLGLGRSLMSMVSADAFVSVPITDTPVYASMLLPFLRRHQIQDAL